MSIILKPQIYALAFPALIEKIILGLRLDTHTETGVDHTSIEKVDSGIIKLHLYPVGNLVAFFLEAPRNMDLLPHERKFLEKSVKHASIWIPAVWNQCSTRTPD